MLRSSIKALVACASALLLATVAAAQGLSAPGPHAVGERTVSVARPDGSSFNALFYYPATSAGANAPFDPAGAPYPGITFGHGFLTDPALYASTNRHLASHGHFVLATTTQGGFLPNHSAFALDMRHCLTWLEQQDADAASPWFGAVDTARFGATGHSMGGGAAILAAAADARIKALAPLAPANTNPSSISAMASVRVPTRIVCGTQDTIVPTASNGQPMYDGCLAPRQILSILNGWHCGFVDTPPVGGIGCDSGALPRAEQLAIVRRHLAAFFLLHLRGDQSKWNTVWGPQGASDATTSIVRDARARFTPSAARQAGVAGQVLDFALVVRNDGATATSYTLAVENNLWPASLSSGQTALLAPGQSETIHVLVTIPAASDYPTDRCLVSARSDLDGATRCYARLGSRRL
ncbi:MAG: dienelactone hydrolase family protein [Planctomycetia bacterium]